MALGGRFAWDDQGETPNIMFAIAEYPHGQKVFFNVRNVNYDGYPREVKSDVYFEDGEKILSSTYISPSGEGQKVEGEPAEIAPAGQFTGEHADEATKLLRDPRNQEFDIPAPAKV